MNNPIAIEWLNSLPAVGNLKPNSIYIIKPSAGTKPGLFVTDNLATNVFQVNTETNTSDFLKTINGLSGTSGNLNLDIAWNSTTGTLSFTGGTQSVNFDARYLKISDFTPWQTTTNSRLTSLETAIIDGLKTPQAFDASVITTFPSATKGTTYKVTVAGTTSGVKLQVGDTIIYDTTGSSPYVVQTNVDVATTTVMGLIRLATSAEVTTGTVNDAAVTPQTLASRLSAWLTSITASLAEVQAGTITNKFVNPSTLKSMLDPIRADQHTHTNKTVLDKISEDAGGNMNYNGKPVFTLGASEW